MMIRKCRQEGENLYFGSVKFFKNLILILVALLAIVSLVFIVFLVIENNDLQKEVERLNAVNPVVTDDSGNIGMTMSGGYSTPPPATSPPATAPPPTWPPSPHELPDKPYASLFPDLYAVQPISANYKNDTNHVYLTFDDGPSTSATTQVLRFLNDYDVKATFFVVPSTGTERLLQRVHEAGHAIGVHSYSHKYAEIYASVEAFLEDFNKARDLIYQQIGIKPDIYRFPGGSINNHNRDIIDDIIAEMNRRGFIYFDWNIDSEDYKGTAYSPMFRSLREAIDANNDRNQRSIVLFHDSSNSGYMTWVLGEFIKWLQAHSAEFTFGVLDTDIRPMQW
jgi:peptidoglycan/xylan/chitin deacetylase (PgdA/CDA1 family)